MNNLNFTHTIEEWTHFFIPLADGTQLAVRAWLPTNAVESPAPAILEYIPYRKRDGPLPLQRYTSNGYNKLSQT